MDENERNELAFRLIEITALSLKELNNGVEPIPTNWKNKIDEVLNASTRGVRPDPQIAARDIEIATEAIDYKISLQQWKDAGRKTEKEDSYNKFLETLATKYGFSTTRPIFNIIGKYKNKAFLNVLQGRKQLAAFIIGGQHFIGQEPDEKLMKYIKAIKTPKPNLDKVMDWIKNGEDIQFDETNKMLEQIFESYKELEK